MDISGFWPLLLAGLVGSFAHEGMRALSAFVDGVRPGARELAWSVLLLALGAAGPLLYGTGTRSFFEAVQLGVSIPAIVSLGFRAATPQSVRAEPRGAGYPRWANYLSWRF